HEKQAEQQARREKDEAERLVAEARQAVASARQAYEDEARRLAALSAENLLADVPVPAIRQEAAGALKALGLDRVGSSALELRTALGEARTLLGRGRAVAAPLLHGEERRRRWWFLVMALFAGPAVAMALRVLLEGIGPEGLDTIGAWSAGVATFLSSVAAWIRAQLAKAGEWIQQVEDAQRRLDETVARAQAQNVQQMREAEERLRLREADYQAARRREEEAQRRAVEARQRLSEASLAGVLSTFIEDRASSTDYRKHLGTLALVRNDFERLSALIEEENWRLSPPVPGEDTARRGLAKFATPEEERADRARRINRIVLYVDDLDRCPPAKVVEVLQAVHLLLAFPLFVVVVGVDARWITRSLEARYRELLSVDARAGEVDEFRELFGSATAHDYLEKIFQVPFWLRPMGDDGARAMVGGLLAPSLAAPSKSEASPSSTNVVQEQQDESGAGEREGPRLPVPGSTGDDKGIVLGRPAEVERAEVPAKREEPELTAESLEITQSELQFMNELAPLLGRSPRALKRFVNVYRLIKAGLPPHERRAFLRDDRGASDYQAVLFLLAVDTGAPHIASRLFQAFTTILAPDGRGKAGEEQVKFVVSQIDGELDGDADWWRVKGWLQSEPGTHRFEPRAMETIARWVPRISRFSFHTGRVPSTLPGLGPDEEAPQG
ncbi:MAG TPA: P-loop NTPase fold protein, partial [Longimicrobium sp.]|nr:P-loop NTPase fold protein [Longimicrobium sp.]